MIRIRTCEITSNEDQRGFDHRKSRTYKFLEVKSSFWVVNTEMKIRKLNHPNHRLWASIHIYNSPAILSVSLPIGFRFYCLSCCMIRGNDGKPEQKNQIQNVHLLHCLQFSLFRFFRALTDRCLVFKDCEVFDKGVFFFFFFNGSNWLWFWLSAVRCIQAGLKFLME